MMHLPSSALQNDMKMADVLRRVAVQEIMTALDHSSGRERPPENDHVHRCVVPPVVSLLLNA